LLPNFDKELAELPGHYSPPEGRLLLAEYDEQWLDASLASMGARRLRDETLYLRPSFRGKGLGRVLAETIICGSEEYWLSADTADTMSRS